MRKLLPFLLILGLGIGSALTASKSADRRASDDINNLMNVDENLTTTDLDAPPVDDFPKDPCGRKVEEDDSGKWYTANPDGSLTPGVIQGITGKKECQRLIKTDNDSVVVRTSSGEMTDMTDAKPAIPM